MPFMLSERTVSPPLTPARVEWIQYVLTQYGVSKAGATQFAGMQPVTDPSDRQKLLDVLNRVVTDTQGPSDHRFRGKGAW